MAEVPVTAPVQTVSYERRAAPREKRPVPAEAFKDVAVKETIVIEPAEVKACPEAYERIGEERTFEIDIVPPQVFKREIVRPKYRHRTNRELPPVVALAPDRPVMGGFVPADLQQTAGGIMGKSILRQLRALGWSEKRNAFRIKIGPVRRTKENASARYHRPLGMRAFPPKGQKLRRQPADEHRVVCTIHQANGAAFRRQNGKIRQLDGQLPIRAWSHQAHHGLSPSLGSQTATRHPREQSYKEITTAGSDGLFLAGQHQGKMAWTDKSVQPHNVTFPLIKHSQAQKSRSGHTKTIRRVSISHKYMDQGAKAAGETPAASAIRPKV